MYIFWIIIRILVFVFCPAFFTYLGTDGSLIDILKDADFLGEDFPIGVFKQSLTIISIFLTSLVLLLLFEINNYKLRLVRRENLSLIYDFKTSFFSALALELQNQDVNTLKLYVWKEQKGIEVIINKILPKLKKMSFPKSYGIIDVEGLSDTNVFNGLSFEIEPCSEGLVGRCYEESTIKYEEDISSLNIEYNLTPFQVSQTRKTKFCLCFPIHNSKNKIVSIISLDSIYSIHIPQQVEQSVADMITIFSQDLCRYFHELTK